MLAVVAVAVSAFQLPTCHLAAASPMVAATPPKVHRPAVSMGLFDMFQESPEQKAAKEAEWQAQQEMMARRRDPAKMAAYEAEVEARRAAANRKDAELKQLQSGGDADAMESWQKLRNEGKLSAFDKNREAGERSLGGEGLLPGATTGLDRTSSGLLAARSLLHFFACSNPDVARD